MNLTKTGMTMRITKLIFNVHGPSARWIFFIYTEGGVVKASIISLLLSVPPDYLHPIILKIPYYPLRRWLM